MEPLVIRTDTDRVATLTLNRPDKLNALSVELFQELGAHVADLEHDPVGAVVLRGAGRCFSAGHDLGDNSGAKLPRPHYQSQVIERLANLPLPVIGAVHGFCYTGAMELVMAADMILAAESARFGDTHAKWDITPIWGMSQRLPRRVGTYKAREMMFTCRTYSGHQAEAMGLVNACVPDSELDAAVTALTSEILAHSSFSHAANKRLLMNTDGLPLREGLAHEAYRGEGRGPDMEARVGAFMSKGK